MGSDILFDYICIENIFLGCWCTVAFHIGDFIVLKIINEIMKLI